MADTITEFINVAGKKLSDIADPGILVLKNSNSETAVIKDVMISNSKGRTLALRVGATDITSTVGSAKLTGTELVGAGTEVRLLSRTVPIINQFSTISWSTAGVAANTILLETFFNDATPKAGFKSKTIASVIGSPLTVVPNFNVFDPDGNFYYATMTNSTTQVSTSTDVQVFTVNTGINGIYKRTGGVSGPETRVMAMPTSTGAGGSPTNGGGGTASGQQKFSWDGKRYIHVMTSGGNSTSQCILQTYDTVTNTSSLMSLSSAGLTYLTPSAGAISGLDEYVFVYGYPDLRRVYVFNHIQRRFLGSFGVPGTGTAWQGSIISGRDSAGNYIVMPGSYGSEAFIYNLGPDISLGVSNSPAVVGTLQTALGQNFFDTTSSTEYNRWTRSPTNQRFAFAFNGLKIVILDFDTLSLSQINPSTAFPSTVATVTVHVPQQTAAEIDFGEVGIRVTGIKTT